MLKFVSFAVKFQINVHDLNNEMIAGNVNDIRMIQFLDDKGNLREEPGVSGRMLKHWHYEAMRQLILNGSAKGIGLCDACRVGEPIRPSMLKDGEFYTIKSEEAAVKGCGICDVHGYLIAEKAKGGKGEGEGEEKGTSARRGSRAMFSWLLPVLDVESCWKQVIHNRVSSDPAVMMPFNKSYASGFYGFVSVLDAGRIGLIESKLDSSGAGALIDESERKSRIKAAVEAYRYLISGQMGASLSHAVPHVKPLEVLVAYSEEGPLPFPVSPIYQDYLVLTANLMPEHANLLYWGHAENEKVIKKDNIDEIFHEVINKI